MDTEFGLRTEQVEAEILACRGGASGLGAHGREQHWIGLPPRILLTPYEEIFELLNQLSPPPGSRLVDLGAGYGRLGLVIGRNFPGVSFIGYECVEERVREARRCLAQLGFGPRVRMIHQDLSAAGFTPEEADYYFLYDFGAREAIDKTLEDLRLIARRRRITVIGRGRSSRDAIERGQPWLSQVLPPVHRPNYSLYFSG